MTTWVKRADLAMAAPNPARLSNRTAKLRGVCVHWSGGAAADPHSTWRSLQAAAMSGHNPNNTVYGDIEYNAGFTVDGEILAGRENRFTGAHAKSTKNVANTDLLGLCLVGETMTAKAFDALAAYVFVAALVVKPTATSPFVLVTHGEVASVGGIVTDCPGLELADWVKSTREEMDAVLL